MRARDLAAAALGCVFALSSFAQEPQKPYERLPAEPLPLEPIERFSGPLPATRNPALANARIVYRLWNISNDQRVEIPHEGFLVAQLHAADIVVIIDGKRDERRGGEFWTVAPGQKLIVETDRDSVTLRTMDTITGR